MGEFLGGRVGDAQGGRFGVGSIAIDVRFFSFRGGSVGLGGALCSCRGGGRDGAAGERDGDGLISSNSSYMSSSISSPAGSSS